ncbi:MAG: hypothetical protein HZA52_00410 [Planctomycetes bacterium]|nr:hypothetical protein [Planctomycetota bacterium]
MFSILIPSLIAATSGTAPGEEASWSSLDRELAMLAAHAQGNPAAPSVRIWGYLRTAVLFGDFDVNNNSVLDAGDDEVGGTRMLNARPYFEATSGDYSAVISLECASGTAVLYHGYAKWKCNEYFSTYFGRFKQPFLRSFMLFDNKLALIERTAPALAVARFDTGIMLEGKFQERVHWWAAVQNGTDGIADEQLLSGRVAFTPIGQEVAGAEGAIAGRDELDCTVAVAVADEGSVSDGTSFAVDAVVNQRPWSLQAEVVDFDKDIGDRTPFSATAGWLFQPQWEGVLRYDDRDDGFNTSRITGGVNYYVTGHDVKWQLNVGSTDADTGGVDGTFVQLGLTLTI